MDSPENTNGIDLALAKQVAELIRSKKNILITTHAKMDCDALSSTIALYLILRKMGKNVTALCQDPVPDIFKFLPDTTLMNTGFSESHDFIITLDIAHTPLETLKWNVEGNKVNIILSPRGEGYFSEENLTFQGNGGKNFDLLIACDAADVAQLGEIYDQNAELFHAKPFLVIDHHASNEGFGTLNYIIPTNASTTETLFDLIPTITGKGYELVDEDIATLLLAGIITDTGSFQHPNTTPKSFEVAAELIDLGARQQEIIKHLFKTKKLTTLRLWGRVLSKIKYDPVHRFVWSTVTHEDLSDEQARSDETEGIIDELLSNAPGVEIVLLLKEREDGVISGSVRTTTPLCDATQITGMFGGGGHRQAAGFKIRNPRSFEETIADIIPKIEKFQEERLGITSAHLATREPHEISVPEKKITALESPADFEKHEGLPVAPEQHSQVLEKNSDFTPVSHVTPTPSVQGSSPEVSPRQTAAAQSEISEHISEPQNAPEKLEEIPDWLREKKSAPSNEVEAANGIPDWLAEAAAEKKQAHEQTKSSADLPTPAAPVKKDEVLKKYFSEPAARSVLNSTAVAEKVATPSFSPQAPTPNAPAPLPRDSSPNIGSNEAPRKKKKKKKKPGTGIGNNPVSPISGTPIPPQPVPSAPVSPMGTQSPVRPTAPAVPPVTPPTGIPARPFPPQAQKPIAAPQPPAQKSSIPTPPVAPAPRPVAPIFPPIPTSPPLQSSPLSPTEPVRKEPSPLAPLPTTPPTQPKTETSPLSGILDPDPDPTLIPRAPKAPPPPLPPAFPNNWTAPQPGYPYPQQPNYAPPAPGQRPSGPGPAMPPPYPPPTGPGGWPPPPYWPAPGGPGPNGPSWGPPPPPPGYPPLPPR